LRALVAVFTREYLSYWRTSTGWIVAALVGLLTMLVLSLTTLHPGEVSTMRTVFGTAHWLLLAVGPAISMRLISEEDRLGTLEPLMATAASDWSIATGKLLAGLCVFLTALLTTVPGVVSLSVIAGVDSAPLVTGYLGVTMTAGLYIGVGMFCSSVTRSQVTAFLLTVFVMAGWNALPLVVAQLDPGLARDAVDALVIASRLEGFSKGLVETADVVFFVSAWWVGVSLTVASLGWRRWACATRDHQG